MLETYYLYSKQNTLIETYEKINSFYINGMDDESIELELQKIAFNNGFDIIIKTDTNTSIFTSNKDFLSNMNTITEIERIFMIGTPSDLDKSVQIRTIKDNQTGINFILLSATLENNYNLYIRMPVSSIRENVKIFNQFLYIIGGITIVIGGIALSIITQKFTRPIVELNDIAKRMARLDFSKKYRTRDTNDEINDLGRSMNTVSEKLEKTIMELKESNIELEKDIEKKSKIDEMRKQFISDVSHELKTPIALIQGYAEGLVENVNSDEESKKMYAEVILDEANKMDTLVKQLLELMKLEYGNRQFNNTTFDICELIQEVIKKSKVMYEEKGIQIVFEQKEPVEVFADDFYIEQVVTNYFTNAIKHTIEVNGKKQIIIHIEEKDEKVRVSVFNTGNNIDKEDIVRIWNRFYKIDSSRNREDGGTGIGLSLVKAIMNNYGNDFGAVNKQDGVEFYFELDKKPTE